MTLPTSAQQIANFVQDWQKFQDSIANGSSWCRICIELATNLQANPNFTTVLSADQQAWVQNCVTYFNSIFTQYPPQPTG